MIATVVDRFPEDLDRERGWIERGIEGIPYFLPGQRMILPLSLHMALSTGYNHR